MHHVAQLCDGGVATHQSRDLLNDVGTVGTIGVTTQDQPGRSPREGGILPIFLAGGSKEFEHTLRGAHRQGLAIGTPEGLVALVGDALSLQLVLRRADTGGLRLSEDGCRHDVEADMVLLAEDVVYGTHGLHLGSMGQHLTAVDIADGIAFTI